MSKNVGCFAMLLLVVGLLAATALPTPAAAFPDHSIRCRVCETAVDHVWSRSVDLRRYCRLPTTNDVRCDYDDMHPRSVDQIVWGVCEALPKEYQGIHEDEFELVPHSDPLHSDGAAKAIKHACMRWFHDEHGVEEIGTTIFESLKYGKTATVLPSMKAHYCHRACHRSTHRDAHISKSNSDL